jgi:hypothetical protein
MNLSNGGRLSKREIHYQFLKREKDPNKTLNKYFAGHDFTKNCTMVSLPPHLQMVISPFH